MSVATYAAAQLLRVLPRVHITRAVGRLAEASISSALSSRVVDLFVRAYDVDLAEARLPEHGFRSFDEFFTRELRPGLRPACKDERALVSPADGRLEATGPVERGGRFAVKGRPYRAEDLLGSTDDAARYAGGQYAIVYLSPRDYHRVHSPVKGRVTEVRSLPGDLFPVNAIGEQHVPSLYAINRRVAIVIDSEHAGRVTVVMVGAMIVGRISVPMIDARDVPLGNHALDVPIERAGEIGVFHLGSTAVVFVEGSCKPFGRALGPISLGESLIGESEQTA